MQNKKSWFGRQVESYKTQRSPDSQAASNSALAQCGDFRTQSLGRSSNQVGIQPSYNLQAQMLGSSVESKSCSSLSTIESDSAVQISGNNELFRDTALGLFRSKSIEDLIDKYAPLPEPRSWRHSKGQTSPGRLKYALAHTEAKYGASPVLSQRTSPTLSQNLRGVLQSVPDIVHGKQAEHCPQGEKMQKPTSAKEEVVHNTATEDVSIIVEVPSQSQYSIPSESKSSSIHTGMSECTKQSNIDSNKSEQNHESRNTRSSLWYKSSSATELLAGLRQPVVSSETTRLASLAFGSLDTATQRFQTISPQGSDEPITANAQSKYQDEIPVSDSVSLASISLYQSTTLDSLDMEPLMSTSQLTCEGLLKPTDGSSSRKSSTSDSAVDLRPPTSDEDNRSESPVPCKTKDLNAQTSQSVSVNFQSISCNKAEAVEEDEGTNSNTVKRSDSKGSQDSGNGKTPERSLSPRIPFSKIQTPSFTQLIHPPSVVISDHSHEVAPDKEDQLSSSDTQTNNSESVESAKMLDKPVLERRNSNSSDLSDRSDSSTRSYMSDSSYSIDDDDFDLQLEAKSKANFSVSSLSLAIL